MNERDIHALIRQLPPDFLPEVRRQVREQTLAELLTDGGDAYADEPATFSAFSPAFAASDAAHFDQYFGAHEGLYAPTLHRHFGCQPKEFASHSGLVRTQITHKNGHRVWHWVRREQPPTSPQTKPHAPASEPAVHELVPTTPGKLGRAQIAVANKLKKTRGGRCVLALGGFGMKVFHAVESRLMYASAKIGQIGAAAAIARGLSPEKAAALQAALKAADFLGGYATGAAAVAAGLPVFAIKASMFLPTASVLYLAYSTAKNPKATWRGAIQVLKDTFTKTVANHAEEPAQTDNPPLEGVCEKLADLMRDVDDPDAVVALFCAAMGETENDVAAALELTEHGMEDEQEPEEQIGDDAAEVIDDEEHEADADDPESFAAAHKDGDTWTTGNRTYTRTGGKTTWKSANPKEKPQPKPKGSAAPEPTPGGQPAVAKVSAKDKAKAAKEQAKAQKTQAAEAHHTQTKAAVADAFANAAALTPEKVQAVTKSLLALSGDQIKAIQSERGIKGGTDKASRVQKLIDGAKAAAKAKPQPAKTAAAPAAPATKSPATAVAKVTKDAAGERTTTFAPGVPEKAAANLGDDIKRAMGELKLDPEFSDGPTPIGAIADELRHSRPEATDGDILAALSHMQKTRQLEGQPLNEVQKLADAKGGSRPLGDGKNLDHATLWDKGRAVHYFLLPRRS